MRGRLFLFYVKKLFLDGMIFSDLINKSNRISERINTGFPKGLYVPLAGV